MDSTCRHCGHEIHPQESGLRHFGTHVTHSEYRCRELLQSDLATARARIAELEGKRDAQDRKE